MHSAVPFLPYLIQRQNRKQLYPHLVPPAYHFQQRHPEKPKLVGAPAVRRLVKLQLPFQPPAVDKRHPLLRHNQAQKPARIGNAGSDKAQTPAAKFDIGENFENSPTPGFGILRHKRVIVEPTLLLAAQGINAKFGQCRRQFFNQAEIIGKRKHRPHAG